MTSIPESPTLAFLIFAKEYTAFRIASFKQFVTRLEAAIPPQFDYTLRPQFPLLHVEFASREVAAALAASLMPAFSLITIDAEPRVLRLWPTPTNHDVCDAIAEWLENDALDV